MIRLSAVAPSISSNALMASARGFRRGLAAASDTRPSTCRRSETGAEAVEKRPLQCSIPSHFPLSISRRDALLLLVLPLNLTPLCAPSQARERRMRKTIPPEEYITTPDGLKYYDLSEGKGPTAERGSTVQVHFDCIYRGITAVSSRESKLLAGNRVIAQPYEFTVGAPPGKERKREFVDNANGLYSTQAAPKPPPALYSITEGMKVGGKRTVIVPPEVGKKGMNEIPPYASFELNVELLEVMSPAAGK